MKKKYKKFNRTVGWKKKKKSNLRLGKAQLRAGPSRNLVSAPDTARPYQASTQLRAARSELSRKPRWEKYYKYKKFQIEPWAKTWSQSS